ncbi:hypothetical protein KY345_03595 [Candidatus Woesearchaeota archaeon]|nr:hypothetical protein [Candidatus Woesearchaeota archaeon]
MKKSIFWRTVKSFKKRWLLDALYNALFFVLIYFGYLIAGRIVIKTGVLEIIERMTYIIDPTDAAFMDIMAELTEAVNQILIVFIIFLVYLILIYSVTEFFIYMGVYSKKFKKMILLRYLIFNLVCIPSAILVVYLISVIIKQGALPIILTILFLLLIYFFSFFNLIYFKEEKVFRTIKLIYFLTITKLHRLLAAFGWMILGFIVLNIPFVIINMFFNLGLLYLIPLIIWLMFSRYYLKNVLDSKNIKGVFKK